MLRAKLLHNNREYRLRAGHQIYHSASLGRNASHSKLSPERRLFAGARNFNIGGSHSTRVSPVRGVGKAHILTMDSG
jgi:hypothetical protein